MGFSRESLEHYFDSKRREQWLANNVIVKFPHEAEIRQETIVDWKVNRIREQSLLDGLKGCYSNAGERDAYMEYNFQRRQAKLKPLYQAIVSKQRLNKPSPIKNIKLTVTPQLPKINGVIFTPTPNLDIYKDIPYPDEETTSVYVPEESSGRDKRPLSSVGRFITG